MRKIFFAAAAVCALGLVSAAQAAPIAAGAAAVSASAASQTTEVAFRHRGPVCRVFTNRVRTPHGWVVRRVRRCR